MRLIAAALSFLALALLVAPPLRAQTREPRFKLPATTYDYASVAVPAGLPGLSFLSSNDPAAREVANQRATLGRVLFYDPLLSRNQTRSCSSCHQQARGFADGKPHSNGFLGRSTPRNSMSIVNLGFHEGGFFWDARAATLEQMVLMPIENPIEMGMSLDALITRLQVEPGYPDLFRRAFGDPTVTSSRIAQTLAEFLRSIVSFHSKYDEGLAAVGDFDKDFPNFTAAENRGKRLFFGESASRQRSCAACHMQRERTCCPSAVILDPVAFQSDECRNNGVDPGRASDDLGLAGVTHDSKDRGKFRAPSLRNVELTGPYMHDGRFATLSEVVQFYSDRVRPHPMLDPILQNGPTPGGWSASPGVSASMSGGTIGLPMTRRERADLVAFLKTLTDWYLARDPRFADPFVGSKQRSLGGS